MTPQQEFSPEAAVTGGQPAGVMEALILGAVREFRDELPSLRFLPESRYDRGVFPTLGQYDWLDGQVLYCLIRACKPRTMIEFSTSSGYSTTFSALAMHRNGTGRVHSIDIDAGALRSTEAWLRSRGLCDVVQLHLGDCRQVVPTLLDETVDLLFIDTLHSFDMARWYLESVIPALRDDVLVHIHDMMPAEARVRIHGGPPYEPAPAWRRPPISHLIKRTIWLALHLKWPNPFPDRPPREALPLERLEVSAPTSAGELPTIDGNYFEEAILLRELLRDGDPAELVYLHRLAARIDALEPQRYASLGKIGRSDARGEPLEWNDSLWCRAGSLRSLAAPTRVREELKRQRRKFYGR